LSSSGPFSGPFEGNRRHPGDPVLPPDHDIRTPVAVLPVQALRLVDPLPVRQAVKFKDCRPFQPQFDNVMVGHGRIANASALARS